MERASGVTRTEDGWICNDCGAEIFSGCEHYHGEWECLDCGEWTYPFHYSREDGCQWCGSEKIALDNASRLLSNGNRGQRRKP